jgi:cell division transport system ATP-binding protein
MLLFDNVSKKYDSDIIALEDIHLNIDDGEFLFLTGPSGAGKTTLMRLLIREELPTTGSIYFRDIDVPKLPVRLIPTYRQKLGVVFQDIKLLDTKTLSENIAFALEILGKSDKEITETTDYLLDLVNLSNRRELFPRQLSGGEQQRGAIARALANNPELFIADEPTGNLDPDNAGQVLDILQKINKGGTTVLVISHDKNLMEGSKARIVKMEKGKIVSDTGAKKEKKEENQEPEAYFKDLDKDIEEALLKAKITDIDMVLNLTDEDIKNLKLSNEQKSKLEGYAQNYLKNK